MFRDLRVVGLASAASHIPTVGAFLNPSALLEKIQSIRHPYLKTILSGFEGVVRPGEMLCMLRAVIYILRMAYAFQWCLGDQRQAAQHF
jgi:hypothetical protein